MRRKQKRLNTLTCCTMIKRMRSRSSVLRWFASPKSMLYYIRSRIDTYILCLTRGEFICEHYATTKCLKVEHDVQFISLLFFRCHQNALPRKNVEETDHEILRDRRKEIWLKCAVSPMRLHRRRGRFNAPHSI